MFLCSGTIMMSGCGILTNGKGTRREYGQFNLDELTVGFGSNSFLWMYAVWCRSTVQLFCLCGEWAFWFVNYLKALITFYSKSIKTLKNSMKMELTNHSNAKIICNNFHLHTHAHTTQHTYTHTDFLLAHHQKENKVEVYFRLPKIHNGFEGWLKWPS